MHSGTLNMSYRVTVRVFCRTFETSLLVDESISDELPYSGECRCPDGALLLSLCHSSGAKMTPVSEFIVFTALSENELQWSY